MQHNTYQKYLKALCAYIEDPISKGSSVLDTAYVLFRGANQAVVEAKDACASSETCPATTDLVKTAEDSAASCLSLVWSYVQIV